MKLAGSIDDVRSAARQRSEFAANALSAATVRARTIRGRPSLIRGTYRPARVSVLEMVPPEKLDADLTRSLVIGGICMAGALGVLVGELRPAKRPGSVTISVQAATPPVAQPSAPFGSPFPSVEGIQAFAGRPRQNDIPPVDLSSKSPRFGGRGGQHQPRVALVTSAVSPAQRLPVEVVNRIVRQSYGRFSLCYEGGLQRAPELAGRVGVKFVVDRTGAVATTSEEASTTLKDREVVQCVVRAFQYLSFPTPQGGIASTTYVLDFAP